MYLYAVNYLLLLDTRRNIFNSLFFHWVSINRQHWTHIQILFESVQLTINLLDSMSKFLFDAYSYVLVSVLLTISSLEQNMMQLLDVTLLRRLFDDPKLSYRPAGVII